VDEWILEDFKQKRKFRRTAKRMWEQLKGEFDFKGSDRMVRNYVSKRKKELINDATQAALPLKYTASSRAFKPAQKAVFRLYKMG
jgi:hypothetical protein